MSVSSCSITKQNVLPRCWAEGATANSRTKFPHTALCGSHRQWKYRLGCSTDSSCLVRTQGRDSSSQKGSKTYTAGRECQRMRSEENGEIFISSKGSMDFVGGVRSPYFTVRTQYLPSFVLLYYPPRESTQMHHPQETGLQQTWNLTAV